MSTWHRVAKINELRAHRPHRVVVDGQGILLCRNGFSVHALSEICPHRRVSMADGTIENGRLVCPHHRFAFELEDGRSVEALWPSITVYPVRRQDDEVFLQLSSPDPND